jgi:DNA polymerase I-like protein with 3'-5' exonuclease and polymerase domains
MHTLFYEDLKQPFINNRKSGNPTLDDDALTKIGTRQPLLRPVIDCIREMRTIGVIRSNVLLARLDYDGRMRCSFNIAGAETFRFSSSESAFNSGTNLQNIPGRDDGLTSKGIAKGNFKIPNIRKLFIPDPGYTFFDIDLSSADLSVVVWESDCKAMKALFAEGKKPYIEIAREFYHDPTIDKNSPRYPAFKAICHATNYLGRSKTISQGIGYLIHEVERIQQFYFAMCPEIRVWQQRIIDELTRTHRVTNAWGYHRVYFDRIDGNVFNEAVAWIPQSTIAILINHIYKRLHDEQPWVEVLLQVHDSLAGQFPTHREAEGRETVLRIANGTSVPYADPLFIPVGIKTSRKSWGDCE